MLYEPSLAAVAERILTAPTRSHTVESASTEAAAPIKVAVVSLVILSLLDEPLSLPASRSGGPAGALAVVSGFECGPVGKRGLGWDFSG